eukprot:s166_g21.t1
MHVQCSPLANLIQSSFENATQRASSCRLCQCRRVICLHRLRPRRVRRQVKHVLGLHQVRTLQVRLSSPPLRFVTTPPATVAANGCCCFSCTDRGGAEGGIASRTAGVKQGVHVCLRPPSMGAFFGACARALSQCPFGSVTTAAWLQPGVPSSAGVVDATLPQAFTAVIHTTPETGQHQTQLGGTTSMWPDLCQNVAGPESEVWNGYAKAISSCPRTMPCLRISRLRLLPFRKDRVDPGCGVANADSSLTD